MLITSAGTWADCMEICIGQKNVQGGPVVQLQENYGRLIDATAFEKDNQRFWNRDFNDPKYDTTLGELIEDAQTVIDGRQL